jgi:outer membrane protein assembly factor BamB
MTEKRRAKFPWFPPVAIVLAAAGTVAAWAWPSETLEPGARFFVSVSIVGSILILLALWFVFCSGLRWIVRWGALLAVALAFVGGYLLLEPEIEFDGEMRPIGFHVGRRALSREIVVTHRAAAPKGAPAPLSPLTESDFPEYRNTRRDGIVTSFNIFRDWTARPPKELWRQPCGGGYAGFVAQGDLLVTIEQRGADEAVVGYDANSGQERWTVSYPADFREPLGGDGPRATPTIAGGDVYSVGAKGMFLCLDAATGARRWNVELLAANANIPWGQCGSPLIVDHLVVVTPGAQTQAAANHAVRAYDRSTGKLVWASGSRKAGYSSPQLSEIAGAKQIVLLDGEAVAGFDPHSGRELWNHPWPTYQDINVAQPLVLDGDRVFVSSGYDHGCAMLRVSSNGPVWKVEELWSNKSLKCKFSSPVLHRGYIYGLDEAHLVCVNAADGKRKWKGNRYGFGQILLAGDLIVVGAENGRLALVESNPDSFREAAIIDALGGNKNWNHLALARGRAYLRNHREMVAFDLPTQLPD